MLRHVNCLSNDETGLPNVLRFQCSLITAACWTKSTPVVCNAGCHGELANTALRLYMCRAVILNAARDSANV
jgi:hypothetical protein